MTFDYKVRWCEEVCILVFESQWDKCEVQEPCPKKTKEIDEKGG